MLKQLELPSVLFQTQFAISCCVKLNYLVHGNLLTVTLLHPQPLSYLLWEPGSRTWTNLAPSKHHLSKLRDEVKNNFSLGWLSSAPWWCTEEKGFFIGIEKELNAQGEHRKRDPLCCHVFASPGNPGHSAPSWISRSGWANARSLLILLGENSWEQIMDYRPILCIFAGVWAAEDMAKEEGMVVGDQLPNRRVSVREFKGAAGRHRGIFFPLCALPTRSSFATECWGCQNQERGGFTEYGAY